jgi:hypothetical protein
MDAVTLLVVSRVPHKKQKANTHVQLPTVPSQPVRYEANALYFGVDNMADQSERLDIAQEGFRSLTVDTARRGID